MIPVVESAELCAFHMPTPCKMAFCKESHRDPQPTGCRRSRLGESPIPPPTMPLFRVARHGASLPEGAVSAARRGSRGAAMFVHPSDGIPVMFAKRTFHPSS